MDLFTYYRSSAAYRVRIVLNIKKIKHTLIPVNLAVGEEQSAQYLQVNPQALVPSLRLDSGQILTQSQVIIDYLDLQYPEPALLSKDPFEALQQKVLAATIACDIHPLNNLRVLKYLENKLSVSIEDRNIWYAHWVLEAFRVIEDKIQASPYSSGSEVSLVDVFLVPQVFNALRFNVPMKDFPKISRVYDLCNRLAGFQDAAPDQQADAVKS